MAEIKYNLEKERSQKDDIGQSEWMKSIIDNPRYAKFLNVMDETRGFNKQGSLR